MSGLIADPSGDSSTLRLAVLVAVGVGAATIGCGLVGFFLELANAMLVIGSGQGLITVVLTLKVWQRSVEAKEA